MNLFFSNLEEDAGHALVVLLGVRAGCSVYFCDKCSSLFFMGSSGRLLAFVPAGSSLATLCTGTGSRGLKEIIQELDDYLSPAPDSDDVPYAVLPGRRGPQLSEDGERVLNCPRCLKVLGYIGEPHSEPECAVREVMET